MAADSDRFVIRHLERGDYDRGYLKLLAQLTTVGDVTRPVFEETMERFKELKDAHKVLVIEDRETDQIVASGTLLIEPKIIHQCSKVGHIEDVVVDRALRGHHLGQRIMQALTDIATSVGCYKLILDCNPANLGFYEKCGFAQKDVQAARYLDP